MWTEKKLNDVLTEPTLAMVEDMKRIDGDILVLGAGGKMGHTICVLASKAMERAGIHKKVIAVSRFHDPEVRKSCGNDSGGFTGFETIRKSSGSPECYLHGREKIRYGRTGMDDLGS